MNFDHIKYMLNSDKMNKEIMLDTDCIKASARLSLDTEILLEIMPDELRGLNAAAYLNNLNL